jgi:hypothetical protein
MNLDTLDELVRLFSERAAIPHGSEFSTEVRPPLKSYEFPSHILDDDHLKKALDPERIRLIRKALERVFAENSRPDGSPIEFFYMAPWNDHKVLPEGIVDMILSNTVLQCVENLEQVYESFSYWLKDSGFMTHNIDFSSYGATKDWNGHWACSKIEWSLMKGKRLYLLNRAPYSSHVKLLKKRGFEIVCDIKFENRSGITRKDLADEFKNMSEEDLYTSGAILQAVKK